MRHAKKIQAGNQLAELADAVGFLLRRVCCRNGADKLQRLGAEASCGSAG